MSKKGFTLIELLIVVAIIAILAAIAIPNFLAAQVRSKVSRVKAELRTVSTGLESYYVDNNEYPLNTGLAPHTPEQIALRPAVSVLPLELSTPIAYLSNVDFKDPFKKPGQAADEEIYTYQNIDLYKSQYGTPYWDVALDWYGKYRLCSIGPDGVFSKTGSAATLQYDPTNGTISDGNIWSGQKGAEPKSGPIYNGL